MKLPTWITGKKKKEEESDPLPPPPPPKKDVFGVHQLSKTLIENKKKKKEALDY